MHQRVRLAGLTSRLRADHLGASSASSASTQGGYWPAHSPSASQSVPALGASPPDAVAATPPSWSKRFATKLLGCSGLSGAPYWCGIWICKS